MKKIALLLTAALTALPLTACSTNGTTLTTAANITSASSNTNAPADATAPADSGTTTSTETSTNTENQDAGISTSDSKILIAYFTRSDNVDQEPGVDAVSRASFNVQDSDVLGNTELLANYINTSAGGDLFPILTVEPYPYDVDETIQNINDNGDHRSELSTHVENMNDYDVVFIGFPIWYSTMPEPVISFLNEYDFSGKTIVPFSTHRGSRFGSSVDDLKQLLPDATILDGFTVDGDSAVDAQNDVANWLNSIQY